MTRLQRPLLDESNPYSFGRSEGICLDKCFLLDIYSSKPSSSSGLMVFGYISK
jgi:hypothetical protein